MNNPKHKENCYSQFNHLCDCSDNSNQGGGKKCAKCNKPMGNSLNAENGLPIHKHCITSNQGGEEKIEDNGLN